VKVLATYNIKGGVGKTSAAVNLGALAARDGLRTLLWDLDPQGSATYMLRIKAKVRGGGRKLIRRRSDVSRLLRGTDVEGLDLLPADFSYRNLDLVLDEAKRPRRQLRKVLAPLAGDYDLAILDCPPSISLASESVFDAADALLVPLIPAPLSLHTFDRLVDFVAEEVDRRPQIIAFFSMVDGRKRLHRELLDSLPEVRREIIGASIPAASDVERMGVHRAAVDQFAPRGRAARAYAELWEDVRTRLELRTASGPS
jgi:cellulose biosynthesis protein BcsQ